MAHRTRPDETRCAKTADSARHVAFNPPTSRTEVSDHGASSCPPWGVLSPPGGQSLFGAHRHPVAAGQSRRRPCRYCVEHELQLALTSGSNNADAPSGSSTNPTTDSPSRCRPHRQPGAPNRPTWRTWRTENSHGAPNRPTWRTENSHGAPNATWRAIHRPPRPSQRAKTKLNAPRQDGCAKTKLNAPRRARAPKRNSASPLSVGRALGLAGGPTPALDGGPTRGLTGGPARRLDGGPTRGLDGGPTRPVPERVTCARHQTRQDTRRPPLGTPAGAEVREKQIRRRRPRSLRRRGSATACPSRRSRRSRPAASGPR